MSFVKKMQLVNNIYQNILLNYEDGQDAYDYLISRGFTEETIELFGYGRSVKDNAIAKSLMNAEGANIEDFVAWGIVNVTPDGEATDFFKGRLMIPIEDENGNLLPNDDKYGIFYSDLIPVLIKAIQDQQQIIDAMDARIKILEGK